MLAQGQPASAELTPDCRPRRTRVKADKVAQAANRRSVNEIVYLCLCQKL